MPLASTNWMVEPTSRPSQFVSIGSQVATLAYHFKIRRGQPIVTILQEVEQKLGLEAGELRLFERSANAYDAVYATDLPSRPRSAESERSRTNTRSEVHNHTTQTHRADPSFVKPHAALMGRPMSSSGHLILGRRSTRQEVKLSPRSPRAKEVKLLDIEGAGSRRCDAGGSGKGMPLRVGDLEMVLVM